MGALGNERRLAKALSSLSHMGRESSWGWADFVPFPLFPDMERLNTLQAVIRQVLQLFP